MKTPPQPSTSTSSTSSSLSGYRIVNMNLLARLFRQLLCPQCKTQSIDLQVKPARGSGTGTAGIHSVLLAQCEKCNETITSAPTSEITVPDSVSVANIRTVASARNCGLGYKQLIQFMAGVDIPQVMHLRTYQRIAEKVHESAVACQEECYIQAVKAENTTVIWTRH